MANLGLSVFKILSNLANITYPRFDEFKGALKGTEFEPYTPMFDMVDKFYKTHGVFPSAEFINNEFDFFQPQIAVVTEEFLESTMLELRKEAIKTSIVDALGKDEISRIGDLIQDFNKNKSDVVLVDENSISEVYDKIAEESSGMLSGIKEYDQLVKGYSYGTLNILSAPAGCGKSTTAISMAYSGAAKCGYHGVYMTLELMVRDLWFNILSRHSNELGTPLSAEDLKKALLNDDQRNVLNDVIEDYKTSCKGKLRVVSPSELNFSSTSAIDSFLYKIDDETPLDFVVVDQLQMLKFQKPRGVRTEEVQNFYVNYFAELARSFRGRGLIVIMLSQFNREAWKVLVKKNRADLFGLAEANELERAATTVTVLFATDEMKLNNQIQMFLVKNRNGKTTTDPILTYFDPAYFTVGDSDFQSIFTLESAELLMDVGDDLFV